MQQCCNLALAKKYSTTSSRPSCPLHVSDKSRSGRHMIGLDSRRRCKPLETKLLEAARANLVSLSLSGLSIGTAPWLQAATEDFHVFPGIQGGSGYRKVTNITKMSHHGYSVKRGFPWVSTLGHRITIKPTSNTRRTIAICRIGACCMSKTRSFYRAQRLDASTDAK